MITTECAVAGAVVASNTTVATAMDRHIIITIELPRDRGRARGEPVSSDYHNKNLQISSGGAAARAGLIDRSRAGSDIARRVRARRDRRPA